MKLPNANREHSEHGPTVVWLVLCAWCRKKYKVVVGGIHGNKEMK